MESSLRAVIASSLKPEQTKPLLELCLIYLSRHLHVDIITYQLFQLPHTHLTAIREKLFAINMQCQFTDMVFKCAFENDYESLPKWNWNRWCENVVANSTKIVKCAVISCDNKKVIKLDCSKNFAITNEETNEICKTIGTSNWLTSTSITFEGRKYILSTRHPSMVFGNLLEEDSITDDGLNKLGSIDSSCIIASVKITKEQRMLIVAISSSTLTGSNSIVPGIISMQILAEEVTRNCKYLAEYFAYINGENPSNASSHFI